MSHRIYSIAVAVGFTLTMLGTTADARTLVVGGKAFTEQYVMAEITKQLLEREGFQAQTKVGFATDKIREAQLAGELDITWDYTWSGYAFHHGLPGRPNVDEVMRRLRLVDEPQGLVWLDRSSVNNTYGLAVNLDWAAENCVHSLDDLANLVRSGANIRLASDQECHKREDCLLGVYKAYNFTLPEKNISVMNVAETFEALRERKADVGVVYMTEGKIPAYDLEVLNDPKVVFAEYYLVPVVRKATLAEFPKLKAILDKIVKAMDQATQQDLHYRIDVVGQPVNEVATYFIASKGL